MPHDSHDQHDIGHAHLASFLANASHLALYERIPALLRTLPQTSTPGTGFPAASKSRYQFQTTASTQMIHTVAMLCDGRNPCGRTSNRYNDAFNMIVATALCAQLTHKSGGL